MEKKKPNYKSFIRSVCVFGVIVFLRIAIANQENIALGMLVFNFVALDYVIFDIFYDAYILLKDRLSKTSLAISAIKRKKCTIRIWLILGFVILLALEFAYSLFWQSLLFNDLFAILALFLSLENDVLVELVLTVLRKIIKV